MLIDASNGLVVSMCAISPSVCLKPFLRLSHRLSAPLPMLPQAVAKASSIRSMAPSVICPQSVDLLRLTSYSLPSLTRAAW
ncbi:hypothetical protein D3C76_1589980 [compost metagenome]